MSQVLTLQIPEEIYQPLLEIAQRNGKTPEEFTIQWLASSLQDFANDPVESFIGSVNSEMGDWTNQCDRYLSQNLLDPQE
ncbi:MAG: hypothetical protein AB4290_22370 [Spirulina sp.]